VQRERALLLVLRDGQGDMSDSTVDPALEAAARWARSYAVACGEAVDAGNACIEIANRAVGARNMAGQRPQHEISIRNFTTMAERTEQEFVPLYKAFVAACAVARDAAANLLAAQSSHDPELILLTAVDDDLYGQTGVAVHLLRANFGATPVGFLDGLQEANAAIQADVFAFGEEGFGGQIYAPALSTERVCPWCAETIKAAAVICRFCGRDVQVSPDVTPPA